MTDKEINEAISKLDLTGETTGETKAFREGFKTGARWAQEQALSPMEIFRQLPNIQDPSDIDRMICPMLYRWGSQWQIEYSYTNLYGMVVLLCVSDKSLDVAVRKAYDWCADNGYFGFKGE